MVHSYSYSLCHRGETRRNVTARNFSVSRTRRRAIDRCLSILRFSRICFLGALNTILFCHSRPFRDPTLFKMHRIFKISHAYCLYKCANRGQERYSVCISFLSDITIIYCASILCWRKNWFSINKKDISLELTKKMIKGCGFWEKSYERWYWNESIMHFSVYNQIYI